MTLIGNLTTSSWSSIQFVAILWDINMGHKFECAKICRKLSVKENRKIICFWGWVAALGTGQTIDCFEFLIVFRAVMMGRTWLYDLTRIWKYFNDPRMWRGLLCVRDGGGDAGPGQDDQEQHQEDDVPARPLPGHHHRAPDLPRPRHPGQPCQHHRPQHYWWGGQAETSQEGENCRGEFYILLTGL